MEAVFVIHHMHLLNEDEEQIKMIGVYRTYRSAVAAVDRLKHQPGFCDFPRIVNALEDEDDQGFSITKYPLDKDHWAEGFSSYTYPID